MIKPTKFILLLSILIYGTFSFSQVTIGNSERPEKGALLQLKNIDGVTDGGANANKGLGLPRVALIDRNNLTPLDDSSNANLYIGAVVYNTTLVENSKDLRLCPGLHVWDGTKWNPLVEYPQYPTLNEIVRKSHPPKKIIDIRGDEKNEYWTAWFGRFSYKGGSDVSEYSPYTCNPNAEVPQMKDGKYWFTQNLRTQKSPDGSKAISFKYPNNSSAIFGRHPEYGLLYDYTTLVQDDNPKGLVEERYGGQSFPTEEDKQEGVNRILLDKNGNPVKVIHGTFSPEDIPIQPYEIEATAKNGRVQGICPNGWHVASQREWYQMLYDMTVGGQTYADIFAGIGIADKDRKNTGWFLVAGVDLEGYNGSFPVANNPNYMSLGFDKNGFHILMTGWVYVSETVGNYGNGAWFGTASSGPSSRRDSWGTRSIRSFGLGSGYQDKEVIQWNDSQKSFLSVRCVED